MEKETVKIELEGWLLNKLKEGSAHPDKPLVEIVIDFLMYAVTINQEG